jgi:hypothetical protein
MNYADPLECYQEIGNLLAKHAPEAWSEIEVEALLEGSSVDLLVMYTDKAGSKKNIPYIPMLARTFYDLAKLVSDQQKGLYKKCLFKIKNDGDFKVDFVY